MKTVVNNFKRIVKERGYTQQEVADKMGITQAQVSRIFGGQRGISFNTALSIAKVFDISFPELFGYDNEVEEVYTLIQSLTPDGVEKVKDYINSLHRRYFW